MDVDQLDRLIERLNDGDTMAAERAFLAYEPYLRMAVRRQLNGAIRSKLDSMDIVQSVWADLLCGFHAAGWRFTDSSHLRSFLIRVIRNRLIDRRRQHRRALEQEQPLSAVAPYDLPRAKQPRPSEVAQGHELWERMLAICPSAHRDILRYKRQGLPLREIAACVGLHEGSVRRILYDLARRLAKIREGGPMPHAPDREGDRHVQGTAW
jgi:RNA polymerase sigma-70 factor (ECF subfamily)